MSDFKPLRLLLLAASFTLMANLPASTAPVAERTCTDLKGNPPFRFEGVLTHQVFPGPPNFESVRKGDKPESAYIVRLHKPICVTGDDFIEPNRSIDRIQVFPELTDGPNRALWKQLRSMIGKFVTVEGDKPYGEHTGHHHAPLLLPITKIAPAKRPSSK